MTLSIYVMPLTGSGAEGDPRRPAYTADFSNFEWGIFDYGNEPWCLVGILNIDAATDTAIQAEQNVFALPANLDQQLTTAQANATQTRLEAVNIPGTWVTNSNTWRDVVRFVGAVCQFAQRFQGMCGGRWFTGSVTLATTFGSLPANVQTCLVSVAQSFGFDTSALSAGSTLRQVLRSPGTQYLAAGLPLTLTSVPL